MKSKYFSPSVNILRDIDRDLSYIPTQNGEQAFNKISNAYLQGSRSFSIVGSYGSGKSTFILALEQVLNDKARYYAKSEKFNDTIFTKKYIVGEYKSFKTSFCEAFNIDVNGDVLKDFDDVISTEGFLIVVDEFGKFLEYAAKENPDEELYFIQQLAEFANSLNRNILFITTLHQAFQDYALSLTKMQRKEWDKVKGRLIEIPFDEPVEQLLFLASERIVQKEIKPDFTTARQKKLYDAISKSGAFPLNDYFTQEFAEKLFPFDLLSGSIITLAFQSYGQNERSLFSFLESHDFLGLNDFIDGKEYYSISHIYDYLTYNFHSLLNSSYNPHNTQWGAIREAIDRAETTLDKKVDDALKIIKTLGLLSIFGRSGQKVDFDFLTIYAKIALAVKNPEEIIDLLEQKQIIRYRQYNQRYVLFKGTDFDINAELELAESAISEDLNIVQQLNSHFNFPILPAKKIFYEVGTPRYFVFELSEDMTQKTPEGAIDGYINIVFNRIGDTNKLKEESEKIGEAILFGFYQETELLKRQLLEIQKIEIVKKKCVTDNIATRELEIQLAFAKEQLSQLFINSFYGEEASVKWFFKGKELQFRNEKKINQSLSEICSEVYQSTPKLLNELINREKSTSTISAARNKLLSAALSNSNLPKFGFENDKFPPEKTIYLSLLNNTGLHVERNGIWGFSNPAEESFEPLWNFSEEFLESCAISPRRVDEFIKLLRQKPFKLKQGFIDFWVPLFLIMKQQHFALYEMDEFVPNITRDTLEVLMRQPHKYQISYFKLNDVRLRLFNKYRFFLNQVHEDTPTRDTFIETIKPFLSFYKNLVPYSQNTKLLSKEALRLKEALTNAKKPEKVFFVDIPRSLGYSTTDIESDEKMEEFTIVLHNATRELSGAFANLINRIEEIINNSIGKKGISFPENKLTLQKRFKKVKEEKLIPKLKMFLQRINTPLDDRQSWLNSIATAVVNKMPDKFNDADEKKFAVLFNQLIDDLDNISDISKKDINEENEEVLKLELTSFVEGVQKRLIRLPKSKSDTIERQKRKVRELLYNEDKQANIALLLKLLQEEISDE